VIHVTVTQQASPAAAAGAFAGATSRCMAGLRGYGQQSAYCASKGALIPFAKSLAIAWAPDGINVNVVLPGAINTPFTQASQLSGSVHGLSGGVRRRCEA
jgi:NAD(P)-dependent dehydrogenase (short-subunit alcohol dehydrogenase family)